MVVTASSPRDDRLLRFDVARGEDDPHLRRLLRDNPLEGGIRLSLECEPDYFLAAGVQGDLHQAIVAREAGSGRVLGMGGRSVLDAYVNGRRTCLGYLGQLRLDRSCRGRTGMLKEGYRLLRALHGDGAAPYYVTTITEDNRPARRLLEAGLDGLPVYRPLETFVTLALPRSRRRRRTPHGPAVDRGGARDLGRIAACVGRNGPRRQFAPVWTPEALASERRARDLRPEDFQIVRRGDEVAGCLAVWDQRRFKQSVVRGYGRRLRLARPFLNLLAPWLRTPRLPAPGEALKSAFVSHLAVDGDDPATLVALLDRALEDAATRDLDYLLVGLACRNPLLEAVRRAFPHREYVSIVYLAFWEDGAGAAAEVDGRIPHLEVALL